MADGHSREAVLEKRHQIRGFLFYPEGKGGYDLGAAFSCQPNEDGMNSWSWCFSVRK